MPLTKLQKERVYFLMKNIPEDITHFEVELMVRYIQELHDEILTLQIEADQNNEFAH